MDGKKIFNKTPEPSRKQIQVKKLADPRNPSYNKDEIYSILALTQIGFVDYRHDPFMLAQLHLAQVESENKKILQINSSSNVSCKRKIIRYALETLAIILALGIGIGFIIFIDKKL